MKTPEEIEQLAKKQKDDTNTFDEQYGYLNGYIEGYSQCQEDMADKKYTKAQMKACFYHNCVDNAKVIFDDYLKKYVTE
jgi:hypothetical protein